MAEVVGGCLCGAVRYTSSASPMATMICHCTHCQKQSGSAFSVNIAVPTDSMEIMGETVDFADTGDSGGRVLRRFCGKCGSPLFSEIAARPAVRIIKAGTLDDPSWLKPQMNIWIGSAQPWVVMDESLPALPKGPTPPPAAA